MPVKRLQDKKQTNVNPAQKKIAPATGLFYLITQNKFVKPPKPIKNPANTLNDKQDNTFLI